MTKNYQLKVLFAALIFALALSACGPSQEHVEEGEQLVLPELDSAEIGDRKLNVVATTSIIGDVVGNIGGGAIDLKVLIGANQDAHGYEATPQDLVALEQADIIFFNGWDLEEQLAETIEANYAAKSVAISAGIEPLSAADEDHGDDEHEDEDHGDDEHGHGAVDPHVWWSIDNARQWANNSEAVLSSLVPAEKANFTSNLSNYLAELATLESDVDQALEPLPFAKRQLVTNHDALSYFAEEYGFTVVGTVIPAASTSAEPSAKELADLVTMMEAAGVCTVFAENSQSTALADAVSAEITHCPAEIMAISLYTDSIGTGDAGSYIGMYRSNVEAIVRGLR